MDFFKVNGKKIKAPTEITVSPEVLDKAERTVDGTMVVDIIGTKRKVDVSWEYLSKEDMTTLTKAIGGDKFAEIWCFFSCSITSRKKPKKTKSVMRQRERKIS